MDQELNFKDTEGPKGTTGKNGVLQNLNTFL